MNEKSLEEQLADKKSAFDRLVKQSPHSFYIQDYRTLQDDVLRLERKVADMHNEPHAVEWPLPEVWQGMTLGFVMLSDELSCFVVFRTKTAEYRVLAFRRIAGYKVTGVNDEVIDGHPLHGQGLSAYGTFIIRNSPWIQELESINKVHPQYDPAWWQKYQHYMLCFKDRIFEAIAMEAEVVATSSTLEDAVKAAMSHLPVSLPFPR